MTAPSGAPARALDLLDADAAAMVDLLAELVNIPSVCGTDAEHDIQARLAGWLRAEGFETDHWRLPLDELRTAPDFPGMEVPRSEAWGLVGRLPGGAAGPTLMFNGHVDVVPPGDPAAWRAGDPFTARVRGGALYGRGSVDMKGGLVAALFAARALRRSGVRLPGDLLVACVAAEEDGGLGSYGLLHRGWRADACVITEPTGLDIVPANAGALTFRIRIRGRAAHASRRTEGVSAVERFWPVFSALRELERRRNRDVDTLMDRWDIAYPIEIGTVRAGDWSSSVPDLLIAEGRLGVALDESSGAARQAMIEAVAGACAADPWLAEHPAEVEWWGGQFASGRLSAAGQPLAAGLALAHERVTGRAPASWGAPYGSDLRLLTGLGGIPTVQYGPGAIALAHAPDEHLPLEQLHTAARTLVLAAFAHADRAAGHPAPDAGPEP